MISYLLFKSRSKNEKCHLHIGFLVWMMDLMCIFKGLFGILFHLNNSNLNRDEEELMR